MNLLRYATLVFDCDGVLLDSNSVKTEAFRTAAMPWGEPAAEALVAHHVANGGISRYEKFAHFLEHILPEHAPDSVPGRDGPGLETLLASFAHAARSGLMCCSIANGLKNLREATTRSRWMIVSGGDQAELRKVFDKRGLAHLFDGGIFGSPDPKSRILEREIDQGGVQFPALFLGDSRLDHEVAKEHGMDFLFVSDWTDFTGWEDYIARHELNVVPTIASLLEKIPTPTPKAENPTPDPGTRSSPGTRNPEPGTRCAVAQTNLQLYRAMRDCGHSEEAVQKANQAWLLAIDGTAGMFRGSGKPFACHLAGVAGLLCLAGQKAPVVIAGILHAMYQRRVPFHGLSLERRKEYLAENFGRECERLVSEYQEFEVERLNDWSDDALRAKGAVVLMRVADDLEDMLDDAIELHGNPGDADDIRGGAAARRSKALRLGPELLRATRVLNCCFLEQQLEYWLHRLETRDASSVVRTGQYSSFSVPVNRE